MDGAGGVKAPLLPNFNESYTLTEMQIKLTKDGNVLLREMVRPVISFVQR